MTSYDCYAIFRYKEYSNEGPSIAVPYNYKTRTFDTGNEIELESWGRSNWMGHRPASPVATSEDGAYLYLASIQGKRVVQVLSTADGSVKTYQYGVSEKKDWDGVCLAEQGKALYTVWGDGDLVRIDTSTWKSRTVLPKEKTFDRGVSYLAASLDGNRLYITPNTVRAGGDPKRPALAMVDIEDDHKVYSAYDGGDMALGDRAAVARVPGLRVFAIIGSRGEGTPPELIALDEETLKLLHRVKIGNHVVFSPGLTVHPDGKEVYVAGTQKEDYGCNVWTYRATDCREIAFARLQSDVGADDGNTSKFVSMAPSGIDRIYISRGKKYAVYDAKTHTEEGTYDAPYFHPTFVFYPSPETS